MNARQANKAQLQRVTIEADRLNVSVQPITDGVLVSVSRPDAADNPEGDLLYVFIRPEQAVYQASEGYNVQAYESAEAAPSTAAPDERLARALEQVREASVFERGFFVQTADRALHPIREEMLQTGTAEVLLKLYIDDDGYFQISRA